MFYTKQSYDPKHITISGENLTRTPIPVPASCSWSPSTCDVFGNGVWMEEKMEQEKRLVKIPPVHQSALKMWNRIILKTLFFFFLFLSFAAYTFLQKCGNEIKKMLPSEIPNGCLREESVLPLFSASYVARCFCA